MKRGTRATNNDCTDAIHRVSDKLQMTKKHESKFNCDRDDFGDADTDV